MRRRIARRGLLLLQEAAPEEGERSCLKASIPDRLKLAEWRALLKDKPVEVPKADQCEWTLTVTSSQNCGFLPLPVVSSFWLSFRGRTIWLTKRIKASRALWLNADPTSISLVSCIKQSTTKLTTVEERTVERENGQRVRLAAMKADSKAGVWLHLTVHTPGEEASVVPETAAAKSEIEVSTTAAPSGAEFMDGDAFLYVNGNDVCMCSTSMSDGAIQYFLQQLFKAAQIRGDATQFVLEKISDVNKIRLIQRQGIKEIEIRGVLFQASFSRRKDQAQSILGAAAKQIRHVLGNDHDVNSDALQVGLTVKTDRRRKGLKLGEKRVQTLATDLLRNQENGDDFVIITKEDQRIGPKEIYMRSTVAIDSKGKSVERDKAWKELYGFYQALDDAGALEQ